MNVTGMIKRLKGKAYTVTRTNADGSYSAADGTLVEGATITLQVTGSLQPIKPEDLVSLPEGDRTTESFRFYSFPDLKNNDTAHLRKGDVVDLSGVAYRVASVEHWPVYSMSIIVRANDASN